jgi:hypothetical protein
VSAESVNVCCYARVDAFWEERFELFCHFENLWRTSLELLDKALEEVLGLLVDLQRGAGEGEGVCEYMDACVGEKVVGEGRWVGGECGCDDGWVCGWGG